MKLISHCSMSILLAMLAGWTPASWAEDIDLYIAGSTTQNAPKVLMVLDNTSNWATAGWRRNTQGGTPGAWETCAGDTVCQNYVTAIFGNDSNATLKQGQVEAAAIKLVLNELVCNTNNPLDINVGLEFLSPDKGANGNTQILSGYIRRAILPLTTANCAAIISDLDAIISDITSPAFKAASSASYGEALFEAFKYFGGYTDPKRAINGSPTTQNDGKGTPVARDAFGPQRYTDHTLYADANAFVSLDKNAGMYASPIDSTNSCGKNYIIFVGNNWPNKDNASLLTGLNNTSASAICCADNSGNRLADVWTKFLANTDVSSVASQQPVYTYAVNIFQPGATQNADWTSQKKLLQSMAVEGGTGAAGYFEVNGNLKKLVEGFKDIFLSISATNSVFAAASLPVSVNTQGTYLNQVFIGMFRPDSDALQRWNGNLKQYKFAIDTAQNLYLADAKDQAVIDVANTGFIKQCAVGFWTSDTSNWPVSGTPYWERVPTSQTPENGCQTPPSDGISTTFSTKSDWPDGNIVEKGGAGQWLRKQTCDSTKSPSYCGRIIKSCANTACTSNTDVVNFISGTGGVSTSTLSANLLNWVAGGNMGDGPPSDTGLYKFYNGVNQTPPTDGLSGSFSYSRPTVHGDVVHSRPLAINYGTGTTDDIVVYYGAGDGMLHAVDGNKATPTGITTTPGQELWAFVAPEFFPKFSRLKENSPKVAYPTVTGTPTPTPRDYFFDGSIGALQERDSAGAISKVWLFPSMRRGGRMVYAFDATTRPNATDASAPTLKWKFGCPTDSSTGCVGTDADKIGQTWSTPRIVRLKGDAKTYVVFGGGYDSCEDVDNQVSGTGRCGTSTKGQGIFVLNANDGTLEKYIDLTAISNSITAGRVISDATPIDVNLDGYIDVIYIGDTRGNLWRINTSSGTDNTGLAPTSWVTNRLAHMADYSATASARKITYAPDVLTLGTVNVVLIGTGDREHPLGDSSAALVRNRFYGIFDSHGVTPPPDINGNDCDASNNNTLTTGCDLVDVTDTTQDFSSMPSGAKGWVFKLVTDGSTTKEQVVTTPVTSGGYTYFSTFQPTDPATAAQQCSNLGTARGYAVNFLNGGTRSGDNSRESIFTGGGLPPSPVSGVVKLDNGQLVPFILGGKGKSPLEAGKVPITIKATRKQVYRYQKIDTK